MVAPERDYKKYFIGSLIFSPALFIAIAAYCINDQAGFTRLLALLLALPACICIGLLAIGSSRYFSAKKPAPRGIPQEKRNMDDIALKGLWLVIAIVGGSLIFYGVW